MINSNKNLDEGRGNGTLARFKGICLKDGASLREKRWNGKVVNTVSVDDVEYIVCEHWEGKKGKNGEMIPPKRFKLLPEKDTVEIKLTLHRKPLLFQKIRMTQFGIQVNIATTGHKLQGMSKDIIIVVDWNYGVLNWVYVVLSRVRKLSGLFLMKPLDPKKYFKKNCKLEMMIQNLKKLEKKTLKDLEDGIVSFCSHVPPSKKTKENLRTVIMEKKDDSALVATDEISFRPCTKRNQNNIELATTRLKTKSVQRCKLKKNMRLHQKQEGVASENRTPMI